MNRRYFRRRSGRRFGTRKKWLWVRNLAFISGPIAPQYFDLLSDYRTQYGITLDEPGVVAYRLFLRVSGLYTVSSPNSNDGVAVAVFNEDISPVPVLNPFASTGFYDERYMLWEWMPLTDQMQQAASTTTPVFSMKFDIRARRKLQNINETFWACFASTGNVTGLSNIALAYSLLLRLP